MSNEDEDELANDAHDWLQDHEVEIHTFLSRLSHEFATDNDEQLSAEEAMCEVVLSLTALASFANALSAIIMGNFPEGSEVMKELDKTIKAIERHAPCVAQQYHNQHMIDGGDESFVHFPTSKEDIN